MSVRNAIRLLCCVVLFGCSSSFGQLPFGAEIHAGGGYTLPTGDFGTRFDARGHFVVGGGFRVLRFAELQAEYMYNTFGINKNTIARVGIPNGDAHVHSITVNPVVHLPVPGRLGAYATGGVGWYHRIVEATRPVAVTTIFFDPFFGFIPGVVGANQVIASRSRDAVGYNIGAGLTYKLSGPAQLYVESRYHHAFTAHGDTEMLPITIGLRF